MLSSLRNFFLALFISLIVFGVGAYFLVGFIDETASSFGAQTPYESGGGETPGLESGGAHEGDFADVSEFTAVVIGIDNGTSRYDKKQEADVIIVVNINSKTQTLMVSPLPPDMRTETKGYVLRLGSVYAEFGAEMLIQAVRSYTGLQADYYCVLDYKSIESIFGILGDVEFEVPMNMFYDPFADDPETDDDDSLPETEPKETEKDYERINLRAGRQAVNAEKAIQLLRYKDYSNGNAGRMAVQSDFIKEMLVQNLTFDNLGRAKEVYAGIKESVRETNMDARDLEKYAETFFALAQYSIVPVNYPGFLRNENGIEFVAPDIKSAVNVYKPYRKGGTDDDAPEFE